ERTSDAGLHEGLSASQAREALPAALAWRRFVRDPARRADRARLGAGRTPRPTSGGRHVHREKNGALAPACPPGPPAGGTAERPPPFPGARAGRLSAGYTQSHEPRPRKARSGLPTLG